MAGASSVLEGDVNIPAAQVTDLVRKATQLPPSYFVTVGKAKIQADGSLQCKYTASTLGPPPESEPEGA